MQNYCKIPRQFLGLIRQSSLVWQGKQGAHGGLKVPFCQTFWAAKVKADMFVFSTMIEQAQNSDKNALFKITLFLSSKVFSPQQNDCLGWNSPIFFNVGTS